MRIHTYDDLVPLNSAKPAAPFLYVVEGQVEALPHPIPVSPRLHHGAGNWYGGVVVGRLATLVAVPPLCAIVPTAWLGAREHVPHAPGDDCHDVIVRVA